MLLKNYNLLLELQCISKIVYLKYQPHPNIAEPMLPHHKPRPPRLHRGRAGKEADADRRLRHRLLDGHHLPERTVRLDGRTARADPRLHGRNVDQPRAARHGHVLA